MSNFSTIVSGDNWFITENKSGEAKVAQILDREQNTTQISNDWANVPQVGCAQNPPVKTETNASCLRFLIADALNVEMVTKNLFKFKNTQFRNILIFGTVTNSFFRKNNINVMLDDGTGAVEVILESPKEFLLEAKNENLKKISEIAKNKDMFKVCGDKNSIEKLTRYLDFKAKGNFDGVPLPENINLGDTLYVKGNLTEYDQKRFVYAKSYQKILNSDRSFDIYFVNSCLEFKELC